MTWLTTATGVFLVLTLYRCRQAQGKLGGDVSIKREQNEVRTTTHWEEIFPRLHLRDASMKANRQLQDLTFYGGKPDPERFPLGLCEGDCDSSADCDTGLICFQRDPGVPVPGCSGNDNARNDYCIRDLNPAPTTPQLTSQPTAVPTAQTTPDTTPPTTTYMTESPTTMAVTMPVFMTASPSAILVNMPTSMNWPQLEFMPSGTPTSNAAQTTSPVTMMTASPTQNPSAQPSAMLTSSPTPQLTLSPTSLQTPQPTSAPVALGQLNIVDAGIVHAGTLSLCQGDCNDESDCDVGLVCFHRHGGEEVPGCLGGLDDSSRTDYCILAPMPNPPIQFTEMPTSLPPTPQLILPPSQSPSIGTPTATTTTPTTTTLTPTMTTLTPTATTLTPTTTTLAPTTTTLTPTWLQAPTTGSLAIPSIAPTTVTIPGPFDNVRLRLYWEKGYAWQESTTEKFWCMMSDYRGRPGTGRCWHGTSVAPCDQDQVYIADCNGSDRQKFTIMYASPDEVMIKVAEDNRCFERRGENIYLGRCDASNDLQRWFANRGAFNQRRFEISSPSLPDHCASQQHHPKPGEQIVLQPCELPRHPSVQTSFWMRY